MTALFARTEIRQSVQVAVGATLSIIVGTMISGQRWYWALIATFVMGIGVASRGEAIVKGLQRLVGTLAGVLVGIGLATLLSGHVLISAALALVCVFLAYYAFQAAYGMMIFFITLVLALLYGMLGEFKPELLWLRLEETAAGAVIGILAITLVLPVRQSQAFADKFEIFLCAFHDSIGFSLSTSVSDYDPIKRLGQATQDLRYAVGALKRGWLRLIDRRYLLIVRAAMRCAYLAKEASYGQQLSPAAAAAVQNRISRLREMTTGTDDQIGLNTMSCEGSELCEALVEAIDRLSCRYRATCPL